MFAERRFAIEPFAVVGSVCVVAGGFVAAITAASPSVHGTWAAAYLVLVAGVAQIALGAGRALLAPRVPARRHIALEATVWNAGNAAVIGGVLTDLMPLVDVGGILLVAGLAMLAHGVRGTKLDGGGRWGHWPLHGFRVLLLVLLISIPIGLLLARIGPS